MSDLDAAIGVLVSIARANEAVVEVYAELHQRSEFVEVHHGCDIRKCGGGCLVDAFAEVEITSEAAYCWWLEMRFEENAWSLTGSPLKTEHGDQKVEGRLAEANGQGVEEFVVEVAEAVV